MQLRQNTPDADYYGEDSFIYLVCNDENPVECDTAVVYITVLPVNDAPVAEDDNATTNMNVSVSGTVLDNDSDIDGDDLTVNTTPVSGPSNGTVTIDENGNYTYTPNEGFYGTDSFVYEVCDDGNPPLCDQATVTITVNFVNEPLVANDDYAEINEDEVLNGTTVLDNDVDNDGSNLTVTTTPIEDVEHGTLTLNADGTYTYIPDENFNGTDSFVYEVCNDEDPVECDQATVTIVVNPVNDAPVALDDTEETTVNEAVTGNLSDNDSDIDGDNLTVNTTPVSGPYHGTVVINSDGTYTYTPEEGFEGTDSFVYEICDDGNPPLCDQATVTIDVIPGVDLGVLIPNGFSPNGDGINEYFVINNLENYQNNTIVIMNRWGNKVFEATPYKNDWNGTNQYGIGVGGEKLPEGTYFYILDLGDGSKPVKGYIYLKN